MFVLHPTSSSREGLACYVLYTRYWSFDRYSVSHFFRHFLGLFTRKLEKLKRAPLSIAVRQLKHGPLASSSLPYPRMSPLCT